MRLVPETHALEIGRPFRIAQVLHRADEGGPVRAGARRHRKLAERVQRVHALGHLVEHALGGGGPDARQQMQDAKTGDAVARVLGKAQQRQHVLDMRGVEEFQPAEFDEGDVAAGQLDFERAGMR